MPRTLYKRNLCYAEYITFNVLVNGFKNDHYARLEYHTQLAKMSFDEIFDLTAGVYFDFFIMYA